MQYSLSTDCTVLVWRLLDLVMGGRMGLPVSFLGMGTFFLIVLVRFFAGGSTGSSGWSIRSCMIQRKEWVNLEGQRNIQSQIVSTPAKGQHLSNQGRASGSSFHHPKPFPHHPWTFPWLYQLSTTYQIIEMHDLQANIEVIIFTLIRCKHKTPNATGLE